MKKKINDGHNCIVGMLCWICICEVWLLCVHFVNYIQMDMYPLNRGSRSSNECFKNISLMGILVNNDLNRAAGTVGGKTRTLHCFVSLKRARVSVRARARPAA